MRAGSRDAEHEIEIISLGQFPAGRCSCEKWAATFTQKAGDAEEAKRLGLLRAHAQHVAESPDNHQPRTGRRFP